MKIQTLIRFAGVWFLLLWDGDNQGAIAVNQIVSIMPKGKQTVITCVDKSKTIVDDSAKDILQFLYSVYLRLDELAERGKYENFVVNR